MNRIAPKLVTGDEIEPKAYAITRESIATYSRYVFGGRDTRNIHTDDDVARRAGLPRAVAQGRYPVGYLSEAMLELFGEGWVQGGQIDVTLARPIYPGDIITLRGVVTGTRVEAKGTRIALDIWLENQHGERVTLGTASGMILADVRANSDGPGAAAPASKAEQPVETAMHS